MKIKGRDDLNQLAHPLGSSLKSFLWQLHLVLAYIFSCWQSKSWWMCYSPPTQKWCSVDCFGQYDTSAQLQIESQQKRKISNNGRKNFKYNGLRAKRSPWKYCSCTDFFQAFASFVPLPLTSAGLCWTAFHKLEAELSSYTPSRTRHTLLNCNCNWNLKR